MTPAAATARETRPPGRAVARHAVWPAIALAVYLVAHALVLALPALHDHAPTLCVFRAVTGVPCPTCGATRATLALASGEVGLAFRYNPLISAAWLLLPAVLLGGAVFRPRWHSLSPAVRRWAARGVVLVLVVAGMANWVYVIRNLREVERESGRRPRSDAVQAGAPGPGGRVSASPGTLDDR
jgi:hypothetical protein